VRLYDRLFLEADPEAAGGGDFRTTLNPQSLETLEGCRLEPALAAQPAGALVQLERLGYFCSDLNDHAPERPVFNRTVTLKDPWAKIDQKLKSEGGA